MGVCPFPSWVLGFKLRSSDLAVGPFPSEPSHQPEPHVVDHELAQERIEPPQVSDHVASIDYVVSVRHLSLRGFKQVPWRAYWHAS